MLTLLTCGFAITISLSSALIITSLAAISSCLMPILRIIACACLLFNPGIILYSQKHVPVGIKKYHYGHYHHNHDYYMPWLYPYLALVLVKVPHQATHSRGHCYSVVVRHA